MFFGDLARVFLNGGTMVICPDKIKLDLPALYNLMIEQNITIFESTPHLVIQLMKYIYKNALPINTLKTLIIGSDTFKVQDYNELLKVLEVNLA